MDENGNFYASKIQSVGEFHHSSLLSGEPVSAAGEIKVNEGVLEVLSDKSGHYQPSLEYTQQAIQQLGRDGIDVGKVHLDLIGR